MEILCENSIAAIISWISISSGIVLPTVRFENVCLVLVWCDRDLSHDVAGCLLSMLMTVVDNTAHAKSHMRAEMAQQTLRPIIIIIIIIINLIRTNAAWTIKYMKKHTQ